MLTREQYAAWWLANTGEDGEIVPLDEPAATLAAHVVALQDRIDMLMGTDEHDLQHNADRRPFGCNCYLVTCACAYDDPRAVCGVREEAR